MKKNEFYILNSLYNGSIGRADCSYALDCVRALSDTKAYNRLVHAGYIDKESGCLTELGIKALEPYKVNNAVLVKLKEDDNIKEQVVKYAIDNVRASKATGVELAILGQRIHSQYPKFKAKEYGYSTLTKFVSSIKELLIETTDNKRIVFIRKKES